MTDTYHQLVGHFIETAQAHHQATGGVNPQWANWYAERLLEPVNELVSSNMSVDDLVAWLQAADKRYQEEAPEVSWPKAYAGWLLETSD